MIKYIKAFLRGTLIGFSISVTYVALTHEHILYKKVVCSHGSENYSLYKTWSGEFLLSCHGSEDGSVWLDENIFSFSAAREYLISKGELDPDSPLLILCCYCAKGQEAPGVRAMIEERWAEEPIWVIENIPFVIMVKKP